MWTPKIFKTCKMLFSHVENQKETKKKQMKIEHTAFSQHCQTEWSLSMVI